MKTLVLFVLAFVIGALATTAFAQTALNCTGAGLPQPGQTLNICTTTTDPWPAATGDREPVTCRIFKSTNLTTPVAQGPITAARKCELPLPAAQFPMGTYSIIAKGVNAKGEEGAPSAPFAFVSAAYVPTPPLAPTGLGLTAGGSGP